MDYSFLLGAVFGWLLSILTILIQNRLQRREQVKHFIAGVNEEFTEIRRFLVGNILQLSGPLGNLNRTTLTWCLEELNKQKYTATEETFTEYIELHLSLSDENLEKIRKDEKEEAKTYYMKFINTFYLDSKIDMLPLLKSSLQQAIIRTNLRIKKLNEEIEQSRYYFNLSFDSTITKTNYKIITKNLFAIYKNIFTQSKLIINDIEEVMKMS